MQNNDHISREKAIKALDTLEQTVYHNSVLFPDHVEECREALRGVPAADARPVVRGEWIHGKEVGREYVGDCLTGIFYDRWTCSECGYIVDDHAYSRINYNFCPNCGAKMGGGVNNEAG